MFLIVLKANPYHDERGRFAAKNRKGGHAFVSTWAKYGSPTSQKRYEQDSEFRKAENLRQLKAIEERGVNITGLGENGADWDEIGKGVVQPRDFADRMYGKDYQFDEKAYARIAYSKDYNQTVLVVEASPRWGGVARVHGANVDSFQRTFLNSDSKLVVSHDYLKVSKDDRGKGAATEYFRSAIPLYEKLGVREVQVYAALDNGAYTWGKFGFKVSDSTERVHLDGASRSIRRVEKALERGVLSPASIRELNDVKVAVDRITAKTGDGLTTHRLSILKTPNIIRDLETDSTYRLSLNDKKANSIFAQDMADRSWDGVLDLTDKKQMAITYSYMRKKKRQKPDG